MIEFFVSIVVLVLLRSMVLKNKSQGASGLCLQNISEMADFKSSASPKIVLAVSKATEFLKDKDRMFPSLCLRLELGWDLNEVAVNLVKSSCRSATNWTF